MLLRPPKGRKRLLFVIVNAKVKILIPLYVVKANLENFNKGLAGNFN